MDTLKNNTLERKPAKRSLRVEDIVIDHGLDFVENANEFDSIERLKPSYAQVYADLARWSDEHKINPDEIMFTVDRLTIKYLGWDKPIAFLPRQEAFLIGFNVVFAVGTFLGSIAYSIFPNHMHLVLPAVAGLVVSATAFGMSLSREARRRRKKFFLPRWPLI